MTYVKVQENFNIAKTRWIRDTRLLRHMNDKYVKSLMSTPRSVTLGRNRLTQKLINMIRPL